MENRNMDIGKTRRNIYIYTIPSILSILFVLILMVLPAGGEVYEARVGRLERDLEIHVVAYEKGINAIFGEFLVLPVGGNRDISVLTPLLKNSNFYEKSIPCLFDGQGFIISGENGSISYADFNRDENTNLYDFTADSNSSAAQIFLNGDEYTVLKREFEIMPGVYFVLLIKNSELNTSWNSTVVPIVLVLIASVLLLFLLHEFLHRRKPVFSAAQKNFPEERFVTDMKPGLNATADEDCQAEYNRIFESMRILIEISSKMSLASRKRDDVFLKDLLEMLLLLVPKADYGTISVIREGKWAFLHSVGHDSRALTEMDIDYRGMKKIGKTTVVKNIYGHECEIMPGDVADKIRKATKPTSVSLITPLMIGKDQIGSINIDISEAKNYEFDDFDMQLVDAFSGMATSFLAIQEYMKTHGKFQKQIIMSLVKILEIHDPYTKGHSENVASMAAQIAENLGWAREKISRVYWAGLIHDIGKIFVPPAILCKPGKLTESEFETIKKHPEWGAEILGTSEGLEDMAGFVRHHHERWDGRGYPDGLKGDEIPVISRIISVVDAFDAMTSDRPYRPSISRETAVSEIVKNSGTQFDPTIVKAFEEIFIDAEDLAGRK